MTGPEGDRPRGWWRILVAEAPSRLEFENGFADDTGRPDPAMPTMTIRADLHEHDGGTRMTVATTFPSLAAMEQILAMGMEEGMAAAIGQIDGMVEAGMLPR